MCITPFSKCLMDCLRDYALTPFGRDPRGGPTVKNLPGGQI